MMSGWKTWVGAAGTAILGISDCIEGNYDLGVQKIVAAIALIGLGHKLDKSSEGGVK